MHANKIDRVFVGDCYVCEWIDLSGEEHSCEIKDSNETIIRAWEAFQVPLIEPSRALLMKGFPEYKDWDRYITFLDAIEVHKQRKEWQLQARVWFQINRVCYGDYGVSNFIEKEGHVNWTEHLGQSCKTDIKAFTNIEDNAF